MASRLSHVCSLLFVMFDGCLSLSLSLCQSIGTHTRLWYLVDARDQVVGRLASMVALLLQGKNKPIYHPSGEPLSLSLSLSHTHTHTQ